MANIWEKAVPILAGNLNSGLSYLITTVSRIQHHEAWKCNKRNKLFLGISDVVQGNLVGYLN